MLHLSGTFNKEMIAKIYQEIHHDPDQRTSNHKQKHKYDDDEEQSPPEVSAKQVAATSVLLPEGVFTSLDH